MTRREIQIAISWVWLYVYVHTYMYVCMYVYIHSYLYIHICIFTHFIQVWNNCVYKLFYICIYYWRHNSGIIWNKAITDEQCTKRILTDLREKSPFRIINLFTLLRINAFINVSKTKFLKEDVHLFLCCFLLGEDKL